MTTEQETSDRSDRKQASTWSRVSLLAPLAAFAAVEVYAFVKWLSLGRSSWFYADEWDFLVDRKAGDLGDLFRSHNGHWTTVPILMYRFLYSIFGLRTYLPYRLVVLVAYLIAAALLLVVMRRIGVNPWIATAAASSYALFGAGWTNIVRPFQITFTGSLVFGLVYLLLTDHVGPFDRRDWLGLLAGALALMTSGVALVMVFVVGVAVLASRGWRLAAAHMVPLASMYVVWLLVIGRKDPGTHPSAANMMPFVVRGLHGGFDAFWPASWWRIPMLLLLVAGIGLAVVQRRRLGELVRLAPPLALLMGAVLLLVTTAAYGRALKGSAYALQPRYISLVGALLLPALAIALDAFAREWRWLVPVAVALFLAGVPHNLDAANPARKLDKFENATRRVFAALPYVPMARQVPRTLVPERISSSEVTVGWLLDAAAQHRLPAPGLVTPRALAAFEFRLSFDEERGRAPTAHCRDLRAHKVIWLKAGDVLGIYGWRVEVDPLDQEIGFVSPPVVLTPRSDSRVLVLRDAGPVHVHQFLPATPRVPSRICIEPPHARS